MNTKSQGQKYWRSLDELSATPQFREFLEREFPAHASEWLDVSRRGFLKLMGASFALAGLGGLGGCRRWPEEKVAPYAHRPDNRTPGVPVHYTTAWEIGGVATGLLVTSFDGRPIKIEGNPAHPVSRGSADVWSQASVLGLYDPDRSTGLHRSDNASDLNWDDFAHLASQRAAVFKDSGGQGLAILCENSSSPTFQAQKALFVKSYPQARWVEFEPICDDASREGTRLAFGSPFRPVFALDQAQVIASFDADLFGGLMGLKYARDFVQARRIGSEQPSMSRLYVAEAVPTPTGTSADHRLPASPRDISRMILVLARDLAAKGLAGVPELKTEKIELSPDAAHFVHALAADLLANRGRGLIAVGGCQSPEIHALAATLNALLANQGKTLFYWPLPERPTHLAGISSLVQAMNAGRVNTLVILGGNPVYNAPADLQFAEALKKVKTSVHLSDRMDETSQACSWHLPRAHYLESWSDVASFDGTVSIVQPLIDPLYEGKTDAQILAMLSEDSITDARELVLRTHGLKAADWRWKKALFDGVLADSAQAASAPTLLPAGLETLPALATTLSSEKPATTGSLELAFFASPSVFDGRFANNGWLQELPNPITKLTWDNAAYLSPQTAQRLGVDSDDLVTLMIGDHKLQVVALIVPGQAPNTVGLALGYGRRAAGQIGNGVGFDTYSARTSANYYFATGVKLENTGQKYKLSTTQDHHIVDAVGKKAMQVRIPELIKETTLSEYERFAEENAKKRALPVLSLWEEHKYTGHKWGMSIDLGACTGCSACVVACQAENNIPIVGKEQVATGREMHWIRIDRYFAGEAENPTLVHQPVMCVHCENAPCEEVCPVGATVHSSEGLNQMVYNRCIGTRYCSNNCPYKVRRFNFFDYNRGSIKDLYTPNIVRRDPDDLQKLQKNPEVTVRMRGVMEKCTYCVQRIESVRITAKNEGNRPIRDGEITPACAQTCPTQAIVFGDLNDAGSAVSRLHQQARAYGLLEELNTKPRTVYQARVRNPAPALVASQSHQEHAG